MCEALEGSLARPEQKQGWGCSIMVAYLSSRREALGWILSTANKQANPETVAVAAAEVEFSLTLLGFSVSLALQV